MRIFPILALLMLVLVAVGFAISTTGANSSPASIEFISQGPAVVSDTGSSTATLDVGKPKKAGDDVITLQYKKNGDAATQTLTAPTGESGTANTADDLPKDMDPKEKAKRYAKAVNEAAKAIDKRNPPVTATVTEGTDLVTVVWNDGYTKTGKVKVANNTNQRQKITDGEPDTFPGPETDVSVSLGVFTMSGVITGVYEGTPAFVEVGTDVYSARIETVGYINPDGTPDFNGLLEALAADLNAHNIGATVVERRALAVFLREGTLLWDCSDPGLVTTGETR